MTQNNDLCLIQTNLTEINASDITDQADFNQRARDAAFIGTLQAGYTSFHYLRPIWQRTTEEDALIGVGITGIASNAIAHLNELEAADVATNTNYVVSAMVDIAAAARTTTVKPSGTSSLVVGSSSGIHGWHNDFYLRRMRFGKDEAIYRYLMKAMPDLCEDEKFRPETQGVFSMPQMAPQGSTMRTEAALDLLARVGRYNTNWVATGHRRGDNHNNVSCTISVKEEEWDEVGEWMWINQESYNGIAVLPYDGGTYVQAPFENITEEEYNRLLPSLHSFDIKKVKEESDETNLAAEAACAGGACEIEDFV